MGNSYKEQYKDSRWQQKRLKIMERDNWTCQACGESEGVTLNVHHAYYEKGKAPWDYPDEALVTWCEGCHEERHEVLKHIQVVLAHMPSRKFGSVEELIESLSSPIFNSNSSLLYLVKCFDEIHDKVCMDVRTRTNKGKKGASDE